ncbi:MAG: carboxypeptidase regulatory-like domain-containing protein, partial [Phycisphaerales bacterium]
MMRNTNTSLGVLICALGISLQASAEINAASGSEVRSPDRDSTRSSVSGRKARIRVYKDWKDNPRAFDRISVTLTDTGISFDSVDRAVPNLDESAVVVLAGADQDDDAVARTIGNNVFADSYEKAKTHTIWYGRFDRPDPEPRVFKDALDSPIPKASVDIFCRHLSGEPEIYLGKARTDEQGRLEIPNLDGSLNSLAFIVSHPEYGVSRVVRHLLRDSELVVPSVPRTTEAYQRSARGTVMDPEGNPVSGATVQCTNVSTLGEGLINGLRGWTYEVLTDKEGTFSLYLPNEKRRDDRGHLIPPKSKYNVRIEAPKELGLLPYVESIQNDRYAAIVLERGGRFRTFAFEDANGLITDPRKLQYIGVTVRRPDRSRVSIGYNDFKNGGIFPPGEYCATMYGTENYEFQPLVVDERSPDELLFRLPDDIFYHGRVVHGLTGEPMPGAFVMGTY